MTIPQEEIDGGGSLQLTTEGALAAFVAWVKQHITGDEKGEAQLFLDRLFRGFGHSGVREAGATLEMRVPKRDQMGTAFADLVWKPRVLIEMKRRGERLERHYRQAFDYWVRLVPNRPRYVVLCNFDEFWVYDFENQIDIPVDRVSLEQLPTRYGPLAFLFPAPERPAFGNDHQAVTRAAAAHLASCFNQIVARGTSRGEAQRFVLQMLVALFAEDIGLLPRYTVVRLLEDCHVPADSYDLLGGLFVEMNTPGRTPAGRFKGVDYFNGGLFAQPARLELTGAEVGRLKEAAVADWSKVRPEIFGTLFEQSLERDERHAFGAHFTNPVDILKIVRPTIVEPWQRAIDEATTIRRLRDLDARLRTFAVLDPACGSGNFLYIAYRELKRLEVRLFERISELSAKEGGQREILFLSSHNFFGIDINPFAVELAKVTMMIARKLAIDELHTTENALPLDNLDANFFCVDALVDESGAPRRWPAADVIIGNPPFLGAKRLKPERGEQYVKAIRKAYPDVPGMADYCVYWFRKAHESLPETTIADPFRGRGGLVGTQNVRNNLSRVAGLDYITKTGTIVEAVENQPWSGEANVHVSIVNWVKTQDPALLPDARRLWSVLPKSGRRTAVLRYPEATAAKEYELAVREVRYINSALSDQPDVSIAAMLEANREPQVTFQGVIPGYEGFVVSRDRRREWLAIDKRNGLVVKPYLIGRDVLSSSGQPSRSVIDFGSMEMLEGMTFQAPWTHIEQHVLPEVERTAAYAKGSDMEAARAEHLSRWWQFWNVRQGMRAALEAIPRYLVCSRVTKRPIFCFIDSGIIPDTALQVFALADDYSFGILQSNAHWQWFVAKCSKLKADYRYTAASVFHTFPFPQSPSSAAVEAVAGAARALRGIRADALKGVRGGLRSVYRSLDLPGKNRLRDAHTELDTAVLAAYDVAHDRPILTELLNLNEAVAHRSQTGELVERPGIPSTYASPAQLVSEDRTTA